MKNTENEDLNINVMTTRMGAYLKIAIRGSLLYQFVLEAKKQISEVIEEANGYILDLTELKQIDSTGFGVVINIAKRLNKGSQMIIVIQDEYIRDLFNITKIDKLFQITESVEQGLKLLEQNDYQPLLKLEEY